MWVVVGSKQAVVEKLFLFSTSAQNIVIAFDSLFFAAELYCGLVPPPTGMWCCSGAAAAAEYVQVVQYSSVSFISICW